VLPWAARDTILEESGDGDLGGGASANQLIGSSLSGKSGVRFEGNHLRRTFRFRMTAKTSSSPTRAGNARDRFPWFPARFSSSLTLSCTIKQEYEGSIEDYSMCHTSSA
jgi:hypothetical protein